MANLNNYDKRRYQSILDFAAFFDKYSGGGHNPTYAEYTLTLQKMIQHGRFTGLIEDWSTYLDTFLSSAIIRNDRARFWRELEEDLTPYGKKLLSVYKDEFQFEEDEK